VSNYQTYRSENIGPQKGEPRCDGNEVATHWACQCDKVNPIERQLCKCGANQGSATQIFVSDPPE
jgi:hypothetical protein